MGRCTGGDGDLRWWWESTVRGKRGRLWAAMAGGFWVFTSPVRRVRRGYHRDRSADGCIGLFVSVCVSSRADAATSPRWARCE